MNARLNKKTWLFATMAIVLLVASLGNSIAFAAQEPDLWDPAAGPAPQDSVFASTYFGLPVDSLAPHMFEPGNPTINGWILGKPPYDTKVTGQLKAGQCVDFIASSGQITGDVMWVVDYRPAADWMRAYMRGTGTTTGYKATVYNSQPCEPGKGTLVSGTISTPGSVPIITSTIVPTQPVLTQGADLCPTSAIAVATMIGGDSSKWTAETGGRGWHYLGVEIEFKVPAMGRLDYDGGELFAGQSPSTLPKGIVATLWCDAVNTNPSATGTPITPPIASVTPPAVGFMPNPGPDPIDNLINALLAFLQWLKANPGTIAPVTLTPTPLPTVTPTLTPTP